MAALREDAMSSTELMSDRPVSATASVKTAMMIDLVMCAALEPPARNAQGDYNDTL